MSVKPPEDFIVRFADRVVDREPAAEVLDVACGSGRHALFFAQKGCRVVAMERRREVLESLRETVRKDGLPVSVVTSDVENMSLLPVCFDAIVNTFFLWRPLAQQYAKALRPGGVLYFQTFTTDNHDVLGKTKPRRDFLLEPGELGQMFTALEVIHYEEKIEEDRAIATFVAQRP